MPMTADRVNADQLTGIPARRGRRSGTTPGSCTRPGSADPRRTRRGWPSSRSSVPPRSATYSTGTGAAEAGHRRVRRDPPLAGL